MFGFLSNVSKRQSKQNKFAAVFPRRPDGGAVNTCIDAKFGLEFPAIVSNAKKTKAQVHGIAGAETQSTELTFKNAVPRPDSQS
jgi:hypothetical protein